ncbi:hypothetical protein M9Y10_043732 [Tritrichomonas musculus]|uniref:Uncharacterized protein n=1 Tax=Tritrichomonas musculus TaxID=1915356 RepID=A0ABR2K1L9_9EUKA
MNDELMEPIAHDNQKSFSVPLPIADKYSNNNPKESIKNSNFKKNRKEIYGKGLEAKAIKEELGDFNANDSGAYKYIISKFGRSIRFSELLGILNTIQLYAKIRSNIAIPLISRNEKRSFPLLIKYIDRHSDLIIPYLQYISLCDSSFHKIPVDSKFS